MGGRFLSSAGTGRRGALPVRMPNPAQYCIKIVHPWVQDFYPVLGLGWSGGRLPIHFQAPILHWINLQSAPAELPKKNCQAEVSKEFPKQFPEPFSVGKLDVGNFAFQILHTLSSQKLPKINSERVKVGNFLPDELLKL